MADFPASYRRREKKKERETADFPEDVTIDILTCLPVKSLIRFRCVSKHFRALIDGPDFIKRHLNRSLTTKTNHKLTLSWHKSLYSVDLDTVDQALELSHPLKSTRLQTEILGSINGLLCVYKNDKEKEEEYIGIWNLATRNYRNVPSPGPPGAFSNRRFLDYGFGYDSVNDEYKLLRAVQFYDDNFNYTGSEAKVYSLRSNSWQRIKDFPYYMCYTQCKGVLTCGALHWIVSREQWDIDNLIAAFDLSTNEYRLVDQPEFFEPLFMHVGQLEGRLCLLCYYIYKLVDVWVMKDYGVKESWSILFSVPQEEVIYGLVLPLAYSKSGDEILMGQDNNKNLCWYNLKEGRAREVLSVCPTHFEAAIYVESLVPLSGKTEDYAKKRDGQGAKKKQIKDGKKR